jgi:hypothetical protein
MIAAQGKKVTNLILRKDLENTQKVPQASRSLGPSFSLNWLKKLLLNSSFKKEQD